MAHSSVDPELAKTVTGPELDEIASAVQPLEEKSEAGALQAAD